MTEGSSSRSRGESSSRYTPEPTPTLSMMDYEDEQEEQAEPQVEPHAEYVDMDDEHLAYLDLCGDREHQSHRPRSPRKNKYGHRLY